MFKEIASVDDILPGGMRAYEAEGKEIVLCNDGGKFYAFDRRCGHMNAPLDMGTASGCIVTCPMHSVQFEASTGKALSGPVPELWRRRAAAEGDGRHVHLDREAHGARQDTRH